MLDPLTAYIARLTITQGRHAGRAFTVLPWQARFVRGAFKAGASTAALSVARGNGKTTLVAGIACAALDGPLMQPRGEVVVVAASFSQGRVAFDHALAFMADKIADRKAWRVQDTMQTATIENRATGARLRVIGNDPRKAHGLAPFLVLADEPAQWDESKGDRMRAALETAMGKIENSRFVALGTRPIGELHWFSKMLAGACDYAQCHASAPGDKPFQRRTWAKANPSLRHMPDLGEAIAREAKAAKTDGSLLAAFQALRLNGGTADTEVATLLDAGTWERIEAAAERPPDGGGGGMGARPWDERCHERRRGVLAGHGRPRGAGGIPVGTVACRARTQGRRRRPVRPMCGAGRAGEVRPPGRRYRRAAHRCAR